MTARLKKSFHIPQAYFLTNKLNSDVFCQLVKESIKMLLEVGAQVQAVVFDGASENVAMAGKLGCNIKIFIVPFLIVVMLAKRFMLCLTCVRL